MTMARGPVRASAGEEREVTDRFDEEERGPGLAPSTRRSFVGRSAGAFAGVAGAGGLLAACGDDDDSGGGGGSAGSGEESASSGGGDGGGEVQVVNILPPQLGYSAEYIAEMDGFFEKEGLSVKANTARGSAPAIQAILSGTALLSWVGWLESVIAISNRGAPIQAVSFTGRRSTLKLVSDEGDPVRTPQDAVGKRIGIPSEGGTSETTLDLMLANEGIEPREVPRQVTGFTPGTYELIKRKRIAGFIIGGSQEQQFREAQPGSVFLETADYVTDGLAYITSEDGVKNNKAQIEAYMRALKGAMEQIVADGPEFTDTIEKLRSKYDFAELKSDTVAKYYLKYNTDNWMLDGPEQLLKVDKAKWKETYDAAVSVKAAKGGVDVTQNVVEGII
jgi:NitT/TauT family transport system substrate-binding protein